MSRGAGTSTRPDESADSRAAFSARDPDERLEKRRRSSFTRTSAGPTGIIFPKASLQIGEKLIEIVVRIAHVRVFGLVTDLRRKFRVTAMDVRNI